MRSTWLARSIGYGAFALIVLAVIIYLRLPSDFLERCIVSTITENRPDLLVTVTDAKPQFPPGVRLDHLVIRFLDLESASVEFERISVAAAITKLLLGRLAFSLEARAYGGDIRGNLSFADRFSGSGPLRAEMTFSEVSVGRCSYLKALSGRRVEGMLSGTLLYNGRVEDAVNGRGRLEIRLRDGSIGFLSPVLGFDRLDFSRADGEAALENRILTVRTIRFTGRDFQGTLSGRVFLDRDFRKSRLDMEGTLTFAASNAGPQAVSLTGSVGDPVVQFM
ncbi:MAG TPA: type II secretion system protein GspN [Syntrophales bacterium]|jgi:type II secretion system protein N|nr:type II secretion system protein GspN [Syntrophales bacterium]HRT61267.1 type II secretion system protein GspN [Syntrophales bacterium]